MANKKRSISYTEEDDDQGYEEISSVPINQSQDMFGGLIPAFNDNYAPIDIENTTKDLKEKAQSLVKNIIAVYYKSGEIERPVYLDTVANVEAMNLQNLLLQVKASEHLLLSLLNRLNATGSIDNSLYKLIGDTQKDSIALTMQVSNYVRGLPTYFKQLRFELETNIDMINVERTQEMIEQKTDLCDEENPDDFIKKPQLGMRNLLKRVEEMQEKLKTEGETVADNINIPEQPKYSEQPKPTVVVINPDTETEEDMKRRILEDNA